VIRCEPYSVKHSLNQGLLEADLGRSIRTWGSRAEVMTLPSTLRSGVRVCATSDAEKATTTVTRVG